MKVLVTGANGFVGRALCPFLVSAGHTVVPVVRAPSGLAGEFVFSHGSDWMRALTGVQTVVHLAGRAHVMQERASDPLKAFREVNVDLSSQWVRSAIDAGVQRFVFMSTIKVNGEQTEPGRSFKPDDAPAPQDAYAISKWEAEQQLIELCEKSGMEWVIVRPPLVYGPGVKGNFASLIAAVKRGLPLPLGAVNNRRAMIALDNLLSFTALCADLDVSRGARNQTFLVSDREAVSTAELLRTVARAYGCKSRLFNVNPTLMRGAARLVGRSAMAERLLGCLTIDNSRALEMLDWCPPVTMEEQLKKMASHDPRI